MSEKAAAPPLTRPEEEEKLAEILRLAQHNLEKTEREIRQLSQELHVLTETYGPKDTEALQLLHNTQSRLQEARRDQNRRQKARKKPYFGRIDFQDKRQPFPESYYVGRVGIAGDNSEPVVIDWRAPAASVYYESALGPCRYEVKNQGICEIDLRRKRTYEIENDHLKHFFDSDIVATDELLNRCLAQNRRTVLSEIIATIQQEQNAVIRRSPRINLIVQGVAGSGKTTVAMHRISYILYNYAEDFRPEDFYIIGSNRILLNYITGVLPDLDVYGVSQMTMEQLFVRLLYEDWEPGLHRILPGDSADPCFCQKSGSAWFQDLEAFCAAYERREIPSGEIRLDKSGALLFSEEAILRFLKTRPELSMQEKINLLNETLMSRLENELSGKYVSFTPEEKKELTQGLRRHFGQNRWKGSIFALYQEFLLGQQARGMDVSVPEQAFDLYDLAALAYLYRRIKETDRIREASHMIIDEAQDFGMMAYQVLAFCLKGCTYTVMGDISQNIHSACGLNDWEDLKALLLAGDFDRFEILKKSYRNTVEIARFAADILACGSFPVYPSEPLERRGNPVRLTRCAHEDALLQECVRTLCAWQAHGHETIAVICRDAAQAKAVRSRLSGRISLADTGPEADRFDAGILVLPVEYTKGLEFDAVLLYDPSETRYPAQDASVRILYVAATRALHELAVLYLDGLTGLIRQPAAQENGAAKGIASGLPGERKLYGDNEPAGGLAQRGSGAVKPKARGFSKYPAPVPSPGQPVRPLPVNPSPYRFGDTPEQSLLYPPKPRSGSCSVRALRKTKAFLDADCGCGTLRLTPLSERILRVQFQVGPAPFPQGLWEYRGNPPAAWTARAGKTLAEVSTDQLLVRLSKETGALTFFDKSQKLLLAENPLLPRQLPKPSRAWLYFNWAKNEKLSVKGILPDDLEPVNHKARYISFGGLPLRMPLLVSDRGCCIGIASPGTVLCCAVPSYGNYLYMDCAGQIDYYFLFGGSYAASLELYRQLIPRPKDTVSPPQP